MKQKDQAIGVKLGKLCPCGATAVRYKNGYWTCQPCIDKDRAIYGTDRIRSTCGFAVRMPRSGMHPTCE